MGKGKSNISSDETDRLFEATYIQLFNIGFVTGIKDEKLDKQLLEGIHALKEEQIKESPMIGFTEGFEYGLRVRKDKERNIQIRLEALKQVSNHEKDNGKDLGR
jgi:hypothetical protein